VTRPLSRGFAELVQPPAEEPKTRRANPPTAFQLAARRLETRVSARDQVIRAIEKMAEIAELAKSTVAPVPPPPRTPKPPPPPPASRATGPAIDANTPLEIRRAVRGARANVAAGSAPCLLTREQLGPGPSEFMLRQMRAVRDRYEIEAAKQRERDSLRALR
jgi:hypothetical protein